MRFDVPQFIDVEEKVFGPLTFRQFIYLLGGGGTIYILTRLVPLYVAIILAVPIGLFALALAFYKINERPFINMLESAFTFLIRNKLYIWKKEKKEKKTTEAKPVVKRESIPVLSGSRLHDVAWGLDVSTSSRKQNR